MKMRNRISIKAAQTYLKGHEHFKNFSKTSQARDLSTLYIEIKEDFLPEPLIITIILDPKIKRNFHLSIEQDPKVTPDEAKLT